MPTLTGYNAVVCCSLLPSTLSDRIKTQWRKLEKTTAQQLRSLVFILKGICILKSLFFGFSFHAILFMTLGMKRCDLLFLLLLQSNAQRDGVKLIKQMAESNHCSQIKGCTIRKDKSKIQKITHPLGSELFKFAPFYKGYDGMKTWPHLALNS